MPYRAESSSAKSCVRMSELAKRGWSKGMVSRLLGEPDKTVPNPVYRTAAPMRLYDVDRVAAAEATEEFGKLKDSAARRSASAKAVADRKRDESVKWAETVRIVLPDVTLDKALARGFAHWRKHRLNIAMNSFHEDCELPPDTPDGIDAATRRRWAANWLRHACSNYEHLLAKTYGRTGREDAYMVIRQRIMEAVDQLLGPLSDTEAALEGSNRAFRSMDPRQKELDIQGDIHVVGVV